MIDYKIKKYIDKLKYYFNKQHKIDKNNIYLIKQLKVSKMVNGDIVNYEIINNNKLFNLYVKNNEDYILIYSFDNLLNNIIHKIDLYKLNNFNEYVLLDNILWKYTLSNNSDKICNLIII